VKRYVADTHVLLWWLGGEQKRLGKQARQALAAATAGAAGLVLSVISLWEVALLYDEGKLSLPAGYSGWCDALASLPGVVIDPLTRAHIEEARTLRSLVDPHDRLIAATALHHQLPLLTADTRIRKEKRIRTLWE